MSKCFSTADIMLPDFSEIDAGKWAVIACDQFTSEPEYWESAAEFIGGQPSTLDLILPEVMLSQAGEKIPQINKKMQEYRRDILKTRKNSMIYTERRQSDGRVRRGLVGMIDLEAYDYTPGSKSLVRATEGTVLERIPPRVAIRRGACLELPHVMLLIDDKNDTVIKPLSKKTDNFDPAYDCDLMLGGGHISGWYLDEKAINSVYSALDSLCVGKDPLLFAVGDGNHSLASAKAFYEEIKKQLGQNAADHPARYALCEIVNLHDEALEFSPIYRVVFGADESHLLEKLTAYEKKLSGSCGAQNMTVITKGGQREFTFRHPVLNLCVGTLQSFLDGYIKENPQVKVDYIHGEDSVRRLVADGGIGFIFDGMGKDQLFPTVMSDGVLPRKTFSMGHARDKRYYMEARAIKD